MSTIGPIHGPAACPRTCSVCSGRHHWIEDGFDPDDEDLDLDDPDADEHWKQVASHDAQHGTEHAVAFYGCKHCPAWAEYDPDGDDFD